MKTTEEKQATRATRNKKRREAAAAAKTEATANTEALEGMMDVAILSQGDKIIHDGESYVIVSVDSISSHVHVTFPDGTGWTQLAFGTMVDIIARAEKEEEAVVVTPVPAAEAPVSSLPPAVTGGRHYK